MFTSITANVSMLPVRLSRTLFKRLENGFKKYFSSVSSNQYQTKHSIDLKYQIRKVSSTSINLKAHAVNYAGEEEDLNQVALYADDIMEITKEHVGRDMDEIKQRVVNLLKHCIPYGRQFERYNVVYNYRLIESPDNVTAENIKLANIMGWCVAMNCAAYAIEDDVIDAQETRQGSPCWHTIEDIGLSAINDGLLIQNSIFTILKKYFSNHKCYRPVVEIFHDTNFKTAIGQSMDLLTTDDGRPRFNTFTRQRYQDMTPFKTNLFIYKLPVTLAMYLAGIFDTQLHTQVTNLTSKIGFLYQVQSDVMDSFGDSELICNKNSNIRTGKRSWLAVETMERGTPAQIELFTTHYGKPSGDSQNLVQNLYDELGLYKVYADFKKEYLKEVYKEIERVPERLPKKVFYDLAKDLFV